MSKGRLRINPCLVLLNVVFGCAGVVLLGIGIWMARQHATNCIHFLQAFCIGTGLFMVSIGVAGLAGSLGRVRWLLYLNLGVMLALLLAVLGTTVFVLVVTSQGIRAYVSESHKDAVSAWLSQQVDRRMESCTRNGEMCRLVDYTYTQSSAYYRPSLSSVQVGCCEPPSGCNNANATATTTLQADCAEWQQLGPQGFCSRCSSCRAAVAESIRRVWHQVAIFKVIILLILIPAYFLTCYSFKRDDDDDRDSNEMSFHECLNCCYSCL